MSRLRVLVAALLLPLLPASLARAQGPAGTLFGRIGDQGGGVLPGATVTARNVGTSVERSTVADARGFYRLSALPTGAYVVIAKLEGFKTASTPRVEVEAAVPLQLDVTLELGPMSESVIVSAEASILQTATAATARKIGGAEILEVPSSTRNFTHLLTAAAGASADLPPVATNDTGSISPSVNGTKTTSNSVLYNGIDITSLLSNSGSLDEGIVPAPETLEEVKLQTSLYDASTGRSGGGNFQLVTRSGANSYRGTVYGYLQNKALNANDYFFDKFGLDKPKADRAEGGFTFSGPIRKDKVFFFGSFQYTSAETGYVPTGSSRALVPAAFALIPGERTAENIVAAFRQLNPNFRLTPQQISPLALQILNTRNPKTGGFLIPSASGSSVRTDPTVNIGNPYGSIGGDPLVELRQVVPSEFQQYQGSLRVDAQVSASNRMTASYFRGEYPSLDSFPDPSSMVSPFTLQRHNQGQVVTLSDTHYFSSGAVNEIRAGYFDLRNTRSIDDPFLTQDMTSAAFGIANPALLFDDNPCNQRLGHFIQRGSDWSFGGTNDICNTRQQKTFHVSDVFARGFQSHYVKVGVEYKHHRVDTDLPEEQATEFEKIENWQHFLLGLTPEADTQYGFTQKQFASHDVSVFLSDDWRVGQSLTVNLGVRWDWFGWPVEKDGYLGNFILGRVTDPNNPVSGIVVPSNASTTGDGRIDGAIGELARTSTGSTLNGQDLDNIAPRVGFAWTPGRSQRFVVRGGYGIYYDRPSAAFINTVFSNYPHLREVEITQPSRQVPIANAFTSYLPPPSFDGFFPFRVVYNPSNRTYTLFDGTGLGQAIRNPAETLEFRAVDPELQTPYYHHFNVGVQYSILKDLAIELRYNGSRGRNLLVSKSFNIPWDLNDPRTPQFILDRITQSFRAGGGQPSAEDPQGLGYGYRGDRNRGPDGNVINPEIRAPYLGFNDREAVLLESSGTSDYDALQVSLIKRWSKGFQFNIDYTLAKSMDFFSADPGSTAGSGRPDEANVGFSVENDARNMAANWAPSDFDRRHRIAASAVVNLPFGKSWFGRDWQLGLYGQYQTGRPFSVYAFEAGLTTLVFQRLDFAPGATEDTVRQQGASPEDRWFNTSAVVRAVAAGNTPRNFLRGPSQKRVDLSLSKGFGLSPTAKLELRVEVFNLFNWVNLGMPANNVASSDFGAITNTIGGPRIAQLGLRLTF
jgi:hypothetical protein